MAGPVAEVRTVGKQSRFSGDEDHWSKWSFQAKAYLAGIASERSGVARSPVSLTAASGKDDC